MIRLLSLTFLLASTTAQANICVDAFAPPRAQVKFSGESDPVFRREIEEAIPKIETLLGKKLDISVRLTSNSFYSDAFYFWQERAVKMGTRLGDRTPESRLGVFAHEATHSYSRDEFRFLVNGKWMNEAAARTEIRSVLLAIEAGAEHKAATAIREETAAEIHRTRNRENNPKFDETVRRFREAEAKQKELILPYTKLWQELEHKVKISRAQIELLSDVVAVLFAKDKGVIADALGKPKEGPYDKVRKNNPNGARPRAFEINRFKDWQPENAYGNEYTILDPARGVIWELYLKNLPAEKAPVFIEAFRVASEKEVQRLYEMGADENLVKIPAPVEINRDFLRALSLAAKERGLSTFKK